MGNGLLPALIDILADEQYQDIHAPASMALSLCAYTTIFEGDLDSYTPSRCRLAGA